MSKFVVDDNECALHVKTDHCTPADVLKKLSNKPNEPPQEIVSRMKEKTKCDTEICMVKKLKKNLGGDLVNKILDNYFKVEGPKSDPEKWLSNDDIDKTLMLWKKLPNISKFYPIPFQMRDFEKHNTELASLDFKAMYDDGYRIFACIPNTDWSSGSGQHWFAFFFDFREEPYTLEYFNSSGECPLPEFNSWMNKTEQLLQNEFSKNVKKVVVTRVQNQYDNSSCGCYSLYYIYSRLNKVPWEWFRKNRVPDEKMHDFRKFLFNEDK